MQVPERREGKTKVMKQQHLPLVVLKHIAIATTTITNSDKLQQYLPFTVLKLAIDRNSYLIAYFDVATAPIVYGIETIFMLQISMLRTSLEL